jgi:hypothetical protein
MHTYLRNVALLAGAAIAFSACAKTMQVESGGEVGAVTPANANILPSGTAITAKLDQSLGAKTSHVGDNFTATVTNAVAAQNGATVVPAGAKLHGHITGLRDAATSSDQALVRLDFDSLTINNRTYPFDAEVTNVTVANRPVTSDVTKSAAVGAAAGAVLGAVIGKGDLDKIIAGGLLGAAAGTVISLGTGGNEHVLPEGSTLTIRSTENVTLNR